jgi:hypothetical protein
MQTRSGRNRDIPLPFISDPVPRFYTDHGPCPYYTLILATKIARRQDRKAGKNILL